MDVILQNSEGGVDSALLYAKTISKYMKDLMSYVEKRTSLGEQASLFKDHFRNKKSSALEVHLFFPTFFCLLLCGKIEINFDGIHLLDD